MKIEIEAEDLFTLKRDIEEKDSLIKQLQADLYDVNPHKVNEDVRKQAYELFQKYIKSIFKLLGFKDSGRVIDFDCGYWHKVRDGDWSEIEEMEANIGAVIEKNFRSAYIRIGVKIK